MQNENEYYIKLYNYILKDSRLNSNDKIIYSYINNLNETNDLCYISNNKLSEELGISKKTIQTSINKMIELKLLKKRHIKKGLKTFRILENINNNLKSKTYDIKEIPEIFEYDWLNTVEN